MLAHLAISHTCEKCSKVITGIVYYRHIKTCNGLTAFVAESPASTPIPVIAAATQTLEAPVAPKRGRGRPRKVTPETPTPIITPPTPIEPPTEPEPQTEPAPIKRKRGRPSKAEIEARKAAEKEAREDARADKEFQIDYPASPNEKGVILVPRCVEDEIATENYIKSGDKRSLLALPEGANAGLHHDIMIGSRTFNGLVRIGKKNEKNNKITVYSYEHRTMRPGEDEYSFYGAVFYWRPLEIGGEDIAKLERAMGINGH